MSENDGKGETNKDDCDGWKIAAYVLVGFCILLDLRIGLNGSPFTIKRFRIPEHLFSLYVSRLNDGMEFSSAVGSAMGTALVLSLGKDKKNEKAYLAIVMNWLFWLSDMIFIVVYTTGGEYGHDTLFYWTLCFSSWTYGANQAFIFPMAGSCTVYYLSTVHASSIFTSVLHWCMLKLVGNRRKYDTDMIVMVVQIVASIFFTLASAAVFTLSYWSSVAEALRGAAGAIGKLINSGKTTKRELTTGTGNNDLTTPVLGVKDRAGALTGCGLSDLQNKAQTLHDNLGGGNGDNTDLTQDLNNLKDALNRAADALDFSFNCDDSTLKQKADALTSAAKGIAGTSDTGGNWVITLSPMLMCITGLGVVYDFYPAIAPGMLVDFRYINCIDQAILVLTPFPSIIIAAMSSFAKDASPANKWEKDLSWYHATHIFGIIMIVCGILFVISLHYPQSPVAKSIVNKPWTVAFLAIIYYASHLVLIGIGFPGVTKNCNDTNRDYITTINNFFVRSSLIVFIYISEGYIQEFKHHDRFKLYLNMVVRLYSIYNV